MLNPLLLFRIFDIYFVSIWGSSFFSFAASGWFAIHWEPTCNFSIYYQSETWGAIILVPCILYSLFVNGALLRASKHIKDAFACRCYKYFLSPLNSTLQTSSEESPVSSLWYRFFDRWTLNSIAYVSFVPLISYSLDSTSTSFPTTSGAQSLCASLFQIWAIGNLYTEIVSLFMNSNTLITNIWKWNRMGVIVTTQLCLACIVVLLILQIIKAQEEELFIFISRIVRMIIRLHQVTSLSLLIKTLDNNSDWLITAVAKSHVRSEKEVNNRL